MGDTVTTTNPYTEEPIEQYELYSDSRLDGILDDAVAAQKDWRGRSFDQRAQVLAAMADALESRRDTLAELCTREMGKLISESRSEVEKCAWVCRYYAENAERQLADEQLDDDQDKRSFVARQPLGVILIIMPWNFPYWQVYRCAAPALMAGNTIVLKHASNVTGCALAMERLFQDVDAPDDVFRTIVARGSKASELIGDPRIAGTSLTGSDKAGKAVGGAAGEALKPSVLELGGSDPFVVLDLDHEDDVLENAVQARYMNSGQSCIAAKRFIVLESVYESFVDRFVALASQRGMGDPMDDETGLAPMARKDLRNDVAEQVVRTRRAGGQLLTGGETPSRKGFFYPATVLVDVPEGSPAFEEELFGPAASIFRVKDAAAAIELANASRFGLGGSVWSGDVEKAIEVARGIESGAVYVNRMMASDPRLPFGGIKDSGYGRELSHLGIREFVNEKTISVALR